MPFTNLGQSWSPATLRMHLATLPRPTWCRAVTLHHTGAPSLAQRPVGLQRPHLRSLQAHYQGELGWRSGPHLFVDDHQLWGMTDFRERGVHAVSFNPMAIGIEVLGDYDHENPLIGRGLKCWVHAAAATRAILDWLDLAPSEKTLLFHRDDPKTQKTCPGRRVEKAWVLDLVRRSGSSSAQREDTPPEQAAIDARIRALPRFRAQVPPGNQRSTSGPNLKSPRGGARAPRWTL